MIRFACPGCMASFSVGPEQAGKPGQCPHCQARYVVPPAPTDAPPAQPPPAVGSDDAVEIRPCPKCQSRLSVLSGDVGLDVECPNCHTVYKATRATAPPPPPAERSRAGGRLVERGSDRDNTDDERRSRRDRDRDDADDDNRRPRRSRRRDEDDEDDDDRDRRRRSRRRWYEDEYDRGLAPHRGGMILTFGVVGLVFCWTLVGLVFSVLAWVFAVQDLRAMDAGRMDDSGRSSTNTGKILGIVSLALFAVLMMFQCGSVFLRAAVNGR
ncbi:MAG: hypothetical protein ABGY75_11445 [Gemmataceae bacterium]